MKILSPLLILICLILITGCSKDSRKKLTAYSPHGKEMLTEFEQRFEAANPDTDIQWLDMGSQEIFDRIKTEKENPICDLWSL